MPIRIRPPIAKIVSPIGFIVKNIKRFADCTYGGNELTYD
jgi:hypothetical protein